MEGEEVVNFTVVLVHDTDCKCRATLIDFTTSRSALQLFTTIATHACVREDIIHWRGHYSLVKNVWGDNIHSDTGIFSHVRMT